MIAIQFIPKVSVEPCEFVCDACNQPTSGCIRADHFPLCGMCHGARCAAAGHYGRRPDGIFYEPK